MYAEAHLVSYGSQVVMFGSSHIPVRVAFINIAVAMLCVVSSNDAIAQSLHQHSNERPSIPIIDPAPTPSSIMAKGQPETQVEIDLAPPPPESKVRVLPDEIEWSYIYPEQSVLPPANTSGQDASNSRQAIQQGLNNSAASPQMNPQSTQTPNGQKQSIPSQPERNLSPLVPIESHQILADEIVVADSVTELRPPDNVVADCKLLPGFQKRCQRRMGLLYRMRSGSPYRDVDPRALWSCPATCDCQLNSELLSIDHANDFSYLVEPALGSAQMTPLQAKQVSPPPPELHPGFEVTVSSPASDFSQVLPITEALPHTQTNTKHVPHPPNRTAAPQSAYTSRSLSHASAVIVHPPLIQPNRKNQYSFLIENQDDQTALNVTVQLLAPDSTTIFGVLPAGNSIVADHAALFHIPSIPARGYVEVHVGAISIDEQPIDFVSSISVQSQPGVVADSSQVSGFRQASHPAQHVPNLENEFPPPSILEGMQANLSLPGGSRLIRNPFSPQGVLGSHAPADQTADLKNSPTTKGSSIAESPTEKRLSETTSPDIRLSDRRLNDLEASRSLTREASRSTTSNPITITPSGVLGNFRD